MKLAKVCCSFPKWEYYNLPFTFHPTYKFILFSNLLPRPFSLSTTLSTTKIRHYCTKSILF